MCLTLLSSRPASLFCCVFPNLRACQVMEYPAHDLPVTGLGFAPSEAGVALGGFDLLAGSADYKITLFKSQGESY